MKPIALAYAEDSLPNASQSERFAVVNRWGLALELANRGAVTVATYQQSGIPIAAVQAYLMHNFHPLHPDPQCQQHAITHVKETLMLAAQLKAPRIVTVCGFGHDLVDRPVERSIEFFSSLVELAKALGVRILIEPLSPKRAGAMTHPEVVAQLVHDLNQPDVFSMLLDTGHLLDSGFCLNEFFSTWHHPIEELQLKGRSSAPPDLTWPLARWLDAMLSPPRIICVEHRQPVTWEGFEKIVNWLQQI